MTLRNGLVAIGFAGPRASAACLARLASGSRRKGAQRLRTLRVVRLAATSATFEVRARTTRRFLPQPARSLPLDHQFAETSAPAGVSSSSDQTSTSGIVTAGVSGTKRSGSSGVTTDSGTMPTPAPAST